MKMLIMTMVIMMDVDYEENEDDCKLGGRLFLTVITCFSHFSMFSTTLFCR